MNISTQTADEAAEGELIQSGLMESARDGLLDKGFEDPLAITDAHGVIGYQLTRDDETFYMVAKEYAYNELASFHQYVANLGIRENARLIFYADKTGQYHVIEPRAVEQHGRLSQGKSKKADTTWVELPLSHGVGIDKSFGTDPAERSAGEQAGLLDYF